MRPLLALLLATTAMPALADTITAESTITAVTVYPDGAKITRQVTFTAPSAGSHELLVTDLPADTQSGLMQIAASEGTDFGAFSLRSDRLPPRDEPLTPAQEAAKAEVKRLEAAEREAYAGVEGVQARIDAANARAAFLGSFSGALPDTATPENLKATAEMIGAETLAARQEAALARKDYWPAQQALTEVQEDLVKAQAALAALPARDADYTALSVAVESAAAGEATLTVTHYISDAGWRPWYEIDLTRLEETALTVDRSVLVTQYSGEDWAGVDLTLSTSRPAEQSAPSTLWPELRSVGPEEPPMPTAGAEDGMLRMDAAMAPAPVAEAMVASAGMEGDTVVYSYPRKVDVASGVADLRLPLDVVTFAPVIEARAVPRWDASAFVMASFVNGSEPILPGEALIFREGVLVGGTSLGLIAAGEETELAFGALDAIRIKRDMPVRSGGETGILTTTNELTEEAVITVENLGTESWPVRLMDQVPYTEQTDLEIEVEASPTPSETDVDAQRGILAWDFTLAGGEQKTVTLGYTMSWPDGMVLR
ncbi:MAG: DUF4139 domain-containing protein [Rhodobacter sp.]|nr:DUF4139 domain-containing protein [Rhodobacter sp.]